ncbi:MAG: hypothetical protein FJ390_04970 [Verrucomicrobia bacterium]|nr:hypothetical protein [Verrucomicrobiota bacterium]
MKSLISRLVVALLSFTLVTAHAASPASKEASAPVRENPGSLPILISLDHVSKDLQLTSLQKSVIAGLRSDYRAAAMKLMKTPHQTPEQLAAAQKKLEQLSVDYNQRAIDVLTPVQRRRLRQIERQVLGGTLLIAPSEQKLLGLSQEQQQKIEKIHQDSYQKAMSIDLYADQGKMSYHQQILALRKNRKNHGAKMLKVLTREQRKLWETQQGKKLLF